MNVEILIQQLPPYKGTERLIKRRQSTYDIIHEMQRKHKETASHYDQLDPKLLWKGSVEETARALFNLCKQHIGYVVEPTLSQTVKTPAAILVEGEGDCKHYASMIVGICCAMWRKGYQMKARYRFASYNNDKRHPGHVFAVIMDGGHELWVDPVLSSFDQRTPAPFSYQDKIPPMERSRQAIGNLYDISGIDNESYISGPRNVFAVRTGLHHGGGGGMKHHWLEQYYGQNNNIGKAKAKAKHKLHLPKIKIKAPHLHIKAPHIKIKPGKFLKKVGGAAPRNAYLGLLKLNFGDLAVQIHNKVKTHPEADGKLRAFWTKLGGNYNKFNTAVNMGVKHYNNMHKKNHVSGLGDDYSTPFHQPGIHNQAIGIAPVAIPALLAAAAPIILAIKGVLKSLGVNSKKSEEGAETADEDLAKNHNNATSDPDDGNADVNDDGTVDHGGGVHTKVTKDANGNQVLTTTVDDPTESDDDGATTTHTKTKTKTVTTTSSGDDDDSGGDDAGGDDSSSVDKKGGGAGGGMMAVWEDVTGFIGTHKIAVPLTVGGAGLLIFSIAHKFDKKSKAPVMLGVLGATALVIGGVQLFKK